MGRFSRVRRFWNALRSIVPEELKPQLRFYTGVLVGSAVSLIVYILVFSAFLFGVLQALVAAGTLALAGVTSYLTIRDRRETLARELADRVYVPMRRAVRSWQVPDPDPIGASIWGQLEDTVPYLTVNVPHDLRDLFERAGSIQREIILYNRAVYDLVLSQSLGSKIQASNTIVRTMKGNEPLYDVSMLNLWKSGKTLEQYVADYMASAYPLIKEWRLDLWTDVDAPGGTGTIKQRVGETKDSIEYCDKLSKFMESKPEAVTYQRRYKELAEVGAKASKRIEKELRKRVAPQGSSPAKEPGNPFG